jgi:hypothetical protein
MTPCGLCSEYEGRRLFRNVGTYLLNYMATHPRRPHTYYKFVSSRPNNNMPKLAWLIRRIVRVNYCYVPRYLVNVNTQLLDRDLLPMWLTSENLYCYGKERLSSNRTAKYNPTYMCTYTRACVRAVWWQWPWKTHHKQRHPLCNDLSVRTTH